MNTKKLDEFTFIDGRPISKAFYRIFTLTFMIITVIVIFLGKSESTSIDLEIISIGVIMSMVIVNLSITTNLFTKEYYQKARYYQISIIDTYKYYIFRVFTIKNVLAIVFIILIGDITLALLNVSDYFDYFLPTLASTTVLFVLTSLGFISSTFVNKPNWLPKAIMIFIMYLIAVIASVIVMEVSNIYLTLIAFLLFDVVSYYVTKILLKTLTKKMEV